MDGCKAIKEYSIGTQVVFTMKLLVFFCDMEKTDGRTGKVWMSSSKPLALNDR